MSSFASVSTGVGLPMIDRSRRVLFGYLLSLAFALALVLAALWSMDFPDAQFLPGLPVLASSSAPPAGQPAIVALDPLSVAAASVQPVVTIYGYNFSRATKVIVNAVERPVQFVDGNTLLIPLFPADTAQTGSLHIKATQDGMSTARTLPVLSPARVPGSLRLGGFAWTMNQEARLVLLVLFAGALGSHLHAIKSLVDYVGNGTARESWFWFYISRPFVGMAMALIFYAVIRGGFLAGTPADTKSVNPFGVVALAGLVGMFSDRASQKLAEVFEVMFRTSDTRGDKITGDCAQTIQ